MVLAKFDGFFVQECDAVSVTKYIVSFKYRDTMLKALHQVQGCEMSLAG